MIQFNLKAQMKFDVKLIHECALSNAKPYANA